MKLITLFISILISKLSSTKIYDSCVGLDDGEYYIRPTENGKVVHTKCSNNYAIINVDDDPNWKDYFTSWATYHYAIAGPDGMDFVNWDHWYKPNTITSHEFVVSPDCSICDDNNQDIQVHGKHTTYYMTSTMFGCPNRYKSFRDCSWNWNTYECVMCTKDISDADLTYHIITKDENVSDFKDTSTGLCGVFPHPSYTEHYTRNYEQCWMFTSVEKLKPSIGTDSRFCVCSKPIETKLANAISLDTQTYTNIVSDYTTYHTEKETKIKEKKENDVDKQDSNIIYLYQKDFISGTYRIKKSGTYIIMEDIEFNFNAGDLSNPNDYNSDSWWPNVDQQDEYPGSYQTRDEYFMGFFAGITIEANDVTLDLGGHEVRMSKAFYYQQRFFANIAIKSVAFSLNQGPGIWGVNPIFPQRVIIKNGKVGLSSHHGIHGQGNRNLILRDLWVRNFETHGIELTDFADVTATNIQVGPSSSIAYLTGEYTYGRFTLQRMWRIYNNPDKYTGKENFPILFANRETPLSYMDIFNKLKIQMDMAFEYAMSEDKTAIDTKYSTDSNYIQAKKIFIREDGIPYGATMYGIMLNLYYANVFHVHPSLHHSHRAVFTNVEIHDLIHNTQEYIRLDKFDAPQYKNPYNSAMSARALLGDNSCLDDGLDNMDWSKCSYVGDTLTDAHIAMVFSTNDWGELQLIMMDDDFLQWTLGKHTYDATDVKKHPQIGCNNDRMTHLAKGTMAIRMDGAEEITYNNLYIHDIHEHGERGSDLCGEYWTNSDTFLTQAIGGHFLQRAPYALGYTGNMAHGIYSDWSSMIFNGLKINNMYSDTGLVRGVGAYSSTKIQINKNGVSMSNLGSGIDLIDSDTSIFSHPYAHTKAKPFHVVKEYIFDYANGQGHNTFHSNVESIVDGKELTELINYNCIYGKDGQLDDVLAPETFSCDDKTFNTKYDADGISASSTDTSTSNVLNPITNTKNPGYGIIIGLLTSVIFVLGLIVYFCSHNFGKTRYSVYTHGQYAYTKLPQTDTYGSTTSNVLN